jgi:hypothetical protein
VKLTAWAYIRCMAWAAVTFTLLAVSALSQTNPDGKSPQTTDQKADTQQGPLPTFRAHADLVLVPVTVTDKLNRFVPGLQKEDFRLFEDGVEQSVQIFSGEDAPLSAGALFLVARDPVQFRGVIFVACT